MKSSAFWGGLVLVSLCFIACQNPSGEPSFIVNKQSIDQHIRTLSSDEFLGRKPFTEGETKTLAYLEKHLKDVGLEPVNEGSYFQAVPMVEITGDPDTSLTLKKDGQTINFRLGKDFVTETEQLSEVNRLDEAEVVFCGFGIVAPEYNWNDYEGLDVEGKLVIAMVNDPGLGSDDSTFFKGNTMTYYGRWTYKYEEAARQGAAGILIIHETYSAGYPWFVPARGIMGSSLHMRSNQDNMERVPIQGWLHLDATKRLFAENGLDFGTELRKARTHEFKSYSLNYKASHTLRTTYKQDTSYNVIGVIEGSKRPDEVIIYTAHWDHLGIGQPVDGDSIYNGAVDNASGSAVLLALAERFGQNSRPERTIAFMWLTAEEQGLLGAAYYASNPIYDVEKTVANINLDGIAGYGQTTHYAITGMGHSEMDDYARRAAAVQGRNVVRESEPEKGYFFRSDHFHFARIGIPALYGDGDVAHIEKGETYYKQMKDDYRNNHYHRPSDEYDPELWDLSGIVQDAELYMRVGTELANTTNFPKWNKSSAFNGVRKRDR